MNSWPVLSLAISIMTFQLIIQAASMEVASKVQFLNVAPQAVTGRFSVKNGKIFSDNKAGVSGQTTIKERNQTIPPTLEGDGVYILGAPAIVLGNKEVDLPTTAGLNGGTVRAAIDSSGDVLLVQEKRIHAPNEASQL